MCARPSWTCGSTIRGSAVGIEGDPGVGALVDWSNLEPVHV